MRALGYTRQGPWFPRSFHSVTLTQSGPLQETILEHEVAVQPFLFSVDIGCPEGCPTSRLFPGMVESVCPTPWYARAMQRDGHGVQRLSPPRSHSMASGPAWTWTHFPIPVQPAILGVLQWIAFVEATTLPGRCLCWPRDYWFMVGISKSWRADVWVRDGCGAPCRGHCWGECRRPCCVVSRVMEQKEEDRAHEKEQCRQEGVLRKLMSVESTRKIRIHPLQM